RVALGQAVDDDRRGPVGAHAVPRSPLMSITGENWTPPASACTRTRTAPSGETWSAGDGTGTAWPIVRVIGSHVDVRKLNTPQVGVTERNPGGALGLVAVSASCCHAAPDPSPGPPTGPAPEPPRGPPWGRANS